MNHKQAKKQNVSQIFSDIGARQSPPATVPQLKALDGISFNAKCRSIDLRAGLTASGLKSLPTTFDKVRKMVVDYSQKIKNSVITEIADKKRKRIGWRKIFFF